MRIGWALVAAASLAGCETVGLNPVNWQAVHASVASADLMTDTRRAFAEAYQDQPFELGAISVVAEEHGELHTYSLTPCQNNTHICGGTGRAGHLRQTADYDVVSDAYSGRTFFLSPGGSGYLMWRGEQHPLAWE